MSQEGCLVISDITGYTAFLSESELEHAEDTLKDLLNLMLDRTKPPLIVSRLEGDAVISYAPQDSFLQGQTLLESLESTYVAFRQAIERMVLNTTCTCNACRNIPNLDLKFFVHYGTFILQELGSHLEMVGSDVNLIHRLTKNSITEKTGFRAYAMYTQAVVDALDIGDLCVNMTAHSETYEHLGEVVTYVQDLHVVWVREKSRQRVFVQPQEAVVAPEYDFPLGPAIVWDYITKPEFRAVLHGSHSQKITGRSEGRIGPGTTYYCAHGKSVTAETVVDWQPVEEYTVESTWFGLTSLTTFRLTPIDGGTRVSVAVGKSRGPLIFRQAYDLLDRLITPRFILKGFQRIQDIIEEDIAKGKVVQFAPVHLPSEDVEQAVVESLKS